MSSVAKAPVGGNRPYMMRKGIAALSDLVDGMGAANLLGLAGGKWYYCDPTNGTAGGDALSPATATNSLLVAYNLCRDAKNDGVFFIGGATSYDPSANFTWSNNYCHLIGVNNGVNMGPRSRIVNTAANDLTALFTMSGSGNFVANIKFSDEKDAAADGVGGDASFQKYGLTAMQFVGLRSNS